MAGVFEIKVTVLGAKEAADAFERLPDTIAAQNLEDAAVSGARLIVNKAKINVKKKTGTAFRSIHIGGHTDKTPEFDPSEPYSDIGGVEVSRERVKVEAGTNIIYGPRLEFGFTGVDSLGRKYNQPAYPFLGPAYDSEKDAVVKEIGDALDILIAKDMG